MTDVDHDLVEAPAAKPPRRRRRWWIVLAVFLIPPLLFAGTNVYVRQSAEDYRYGQDDPAIPRRDVAVVFGAGLRQGRPSAMLADRLDGAVELYQRDLVTHVLVTGDNGSKNYDEVSVMRDYLVDRGIPAEAITLDYAGFSTYESCYRAKEIFGVESAALITQHYHLARAIYTCRSFGIDAIGVGRADWSFEPEKSAVYYIERAQNNHELRESLAQANAVLEVAITRPEPTFLGPFEGLPGSANLR